MRHKKEFGTSRALFQSYISDFVWRKKFNGPDIMFHLWSQIAEFFVPQRKKYLKVPAIFCTRLKNSFMRTTSSQKAHFVVVHWGVICR
uniref:Uncharacterized protein n=1 Tax=Ditylenchus dipsaci TaxID=166011 RepID=A0A915EJI9_9BILA